MVISSVAAGLTQITGRANYALAAVGMDLDLLEQPDLPEQPANAAMSAGWFWFNNKLSANASDFITLTRHVNGGTNGLADRQALYADTKKAPGIV